MEIKERLQEIFRDVFDDEELEIRDDMSAKDMVKKAYNHEFVKL